MAGPNTAPQVVHRYKCEYMKLCRVGGLDHPVSPAYGRCLGTRTMSERAGDQASHEKMKSRPWGEEIRASWGKEHTPREPADSAR